MTRSIVRLVLCALIALAAATPAAVAVQRPEATPAAPWETVPLEPGATPTTGTPSGASDEATPEVSTDAGMAPGELVALIVVAAVIGGIAARFAAQALPPAGSRPRRRRGQAQPTAAAAPRPARTTVSDPAPSTRAATTGAPLPARDRRGRFLPAARPAPAAPSAQERIPPPAARPRRSSRPLAATRPRQRIGRFARSTEASSRAERCSIKLATWPPRARYFAIADDTGRVVARSPIFEIEREDGDDRPRQQTVLRSLVDELIAAGWSETGAGDAPGELRFERPDALAPPGSPPAA